MSPPLPTPTLLYFPSTPVTCWHGLVDLLTIDSALRLSALKAGSPSAPGRWLPRYLSVEWTDEGPRSPVVGLGPSDGEGRREAEGKQHCGRALSTAQLRLQPPLIRPQLTEKPFSHQLPLVTPILAVKSGQWPSSWSPERLVEEGAWEVSARDCPSSGGKAGGSVGKGYRARGWVGNPGVLPLPSVTGPGAHSTSPSLHPSSGLPPPCCVTLG